MAMIAALVQPSVDLQNMFSNFSSLFDLALAVGNQLDIIGQWIGQPRNITTALTNVYFSWGIAGLGWNQGVWLGPGQSSSGLTVLSDDVYRILLQAVIAQNNWDGTVPGAYSIWNAVFTIEQFQILIQDNQDMSMTILILTTSQIDAVSLALLTNGLIVPRPAGVRITGYTQIAAPLFGWGLNTSLVAGWGIGNWI
jgi:hypothetical protein